MMKKQNILKKELSILFGDNPTLVSAVIDSIPVGVYDAFGDDAKASFSMNPYRGDVVLRSDILEGRTSILKINRRENEIIIGCSGHPILDVSETIKLNIPNLSTWSKTWNTPLENEWLDFFDKQLTNIGDKLVIMHKIKDLSYTFDYSSEERIYFLKTKI